MLTTRDSDLSSLEKERAAKIYEFSISPFDHGPAAAEEEEEGEESSRRLSKGEVRVKAPKEVPWIDLLLDVAMTTSFTSLTEGTPILQWDNALSYVAYFVFVWWIWASQVCYNIRFRQPDWLHRIWVFAQLIVFSALAAFTKDFDITKGLIPPNEVDENLLLQLQSQLGNDKSNFDAFKFREQLLPRLNARGISLALAFSRLLLLAQYGVVFYHARQIKRRSLWAHMIPLIFSSICYMAAYGLIDTVNTTGTPSKTLSIVKLVLWYFPILVEIVSHYVALHLTHWVRYSKEAVYARNSTVFLIILGAGLDRITGGFKSIVGNAGLGVDGIPIFIAASVIFIGYFALYFATPGRTSRLGQKRVLSCFFAKFFFLSALIVTLQGIATTLRFANFNSAVKKSEAALNPLYDFMNSNPNVNLTASDFPSSVQEFNNLGVSLEDVVDFFLNLVVGSDLIPNAQMQLDIILQDIILQTLEASPDPNGLLAAQMAFFENADFTNVTATDYNNIRDGLIKNLGSSALWFYPAAGSAILALVLMSFIRGWPRDNWEWGLIINRLVFGITILSLGFLDIGQMQPIYDSNGNYTNSRIWRLALSKGQLLLIIMAAAMALLLFVENLLAYLASRSIYSVSPWSGPPVAENYEVKVMNLDVKPAATSFHSHGLSHPGQPMLGPVYDS